MGYWVMSLVSHELVSCELVSCEEGGVVGGQCASRAGVVWGLGASKNAFFFGPNGQRHNEHAVGLGRVGF